MSGFFFWIKMDFRVLEEIWDYRTMGRGQLSEAKDMSNKLLFIF